MKKILNFKRLFAFLVVFILLISSLLTSCEMPDIDKGQIEDIGSFIEGLIPKDTTGNDDEITPPPQDITDPTVEGEMQIHFLVVGQGDCALIVAKDCVILIDSSYKKNSVTNSIIEYIKDLAITEIDFFILTHPHADHIGGAPQIIEEFDIKNVLMPNCVADTVIFEQTLDAIESKDLNLIEAISGDEYQLGDVSFKILAPNDEGGKNINNYSIVLKLNFGSTSVMFTGDAEEESEEKILSVYPSELLKSDILKMGHHGSSTSSTLDFLKAVSPDVAIMSLGEGNSYNHPHKETLDKLESLDLPYYRTDLHGTIVFVSDGQSFTKK